MRPDFRVQPGAEELAFVRDVLNVLEEGGMDIKPLEKTLNQEDDPLRTKDVLELAEEFGKSCAYCDHEQLYSSLKGAYQYLQGRLSAVKRDMSRRLRNLEADNKADPNVIENMKRNRELMEKLIAEINQAATKIRLIRASYEAEQQQALRAEESDSAAEEAPQGGRQEEGLVSRRVSVRS